ncbi:MAG: fatty acid CoA ligase family protein [Planctomycetota bacterium]
MNERTKSAGSTNKKWDLDEVGNVGHTLTLTAARMPDALAVAAPAKKGRQKNAVLLLPEQSLDGPSPVSPLFYDRITFAELESRSNRIANALMEAGIKPGTRLALMIPPGIDFVAHVFGMFKAGVIVILIDPGMGRKNMVQCLSAAEPEGIVGIALAQVARFLFRSRFPDCKNNFVVGKSWWPGCKSLDSLQKRAGSTLKPIGTVREDAAAIIFTTGSTGPPKGVLYRHRIFIEQARQIRDYFDIRPGTVDVSGFPLFALFNTAMGTTTVFPEMDATRPAQIHPPNLIDAVYQFEADQSFGSPALWNTVSRYLEDNGLKLESIKRILSAGAPVPPHVLERIKSVISPEGEAFTPYGATESLPVACNSALSVLTETGELTATGHGTCVGHRFEDMNWKVIEISEDPIANLSQAKELPAGEIGELIVSGVVVTDRYVTRTDANAEHKIGENCDLDFSTEPTSSPMIDGSEDQRIWHRMGDVGYFDESGRFWFCGRKSHRVQTSRGVLFTIRCEGIINSHPAVYRSALVGVRKSGDEHEHPVVVVETWPEKRPQTEPEEQRLIEELRDLARRYEVTSTLNDFLLNDSLPVDIRHNSKIFREQLRTWAAERLGVS